MKNNLKKAVVVGPVVKRVAETTTCETPYLLGDGRILVLITTKPNAPANFGLIDANIYSKEHYDEYVAQVISAATRK